MLDIINVIHTLKKYEISQIKELLIFVGTIDFSCGHASPWPPLPPFQLPDPTNYNRTCNRI